MSKQVVQWDDKIQKMVKQHLMKYIKGPSIYSIEIPKLQYNSKKQGPRFSTDH